MPGVGNAGAEEGRLEETRVVVPHDLRRRDGGQVGRPLMRAAGAERLAEAEEDEGPARRAARMPTKSMAAWPRSPRDPPAR
jgi:hypothetical protein